MSAFDTVELEPITDPIAPEESFDWLSSVTLFALTVLLITVAWITMRLFLKRIGKGQKNGKYLGLKEMKIEVKALVKDDADPNRLDVTRYWDLIQGYLCYRGFVSQASPSLEEIEEQIGRDQQLKYSNRKKLLELIPLVEAYKFQGNAQSDDRLRMTELFLQLFQEFTTSENEQ